MKGSKYKVLLHPDVRAYLDSLEEDSRNRCYESLKQLAIDPVKKRSGCDIKKLAGKRVSIYRLRAGAHRFDYLVEGNEVLVEDGFTRGRGYKVREGVEEMNENINA